MSAVLALLVAVDPFGLARVWPRRPMVAVIVAAVLAAAALVAPTVLDALDLSPEGFWIAAGIVLLVPACNRFVSATTRDVAGPAGVLVAMAVATRDGRGITLVAAGITGVAVLFAAHVPVGRWTPVVERIVAALMVVVAFDLIRDGVISV
jgi:small neutral amino acid transporter SnatA (MarC family)